MKALLFFVFVLTLYNESDTQEIEDAIDLIKINCKDFKKLTIGSLMYYTSAKKNTDNVEINVYLSTNKHKEPVKINASFIESLKNSEFDPSKKSIIIIHGYKSAATKKWVLNMKDKLLEVRDVNVFMVDWSNGGSNSWNYVNSARRTQVASHQLAKFLENLKLPAASFKVLKKDIQWNHLYFIGHSLGAHLSGQTAHLLKQNDFWKVERITGLDPAQPCFINADLSMKLGKDDADFVDIIHTQTGTKGNDDALGIKEDLGHMDFYINGGVMQPECVDNYFSVELNEMVCSHKLSSSYFIESIVNLINGTCKFLSYPWNGSYEDAFDKLELKLNGKLEDCTTCPTMGIEASASKREGKYIVFTGAKKPYCVTKLEDYNAVKKAIEVITEKPGPSLDDMPEIHSQVDFVPINPYNNFVPMFTMDMWNQMKWDHWYEKNKKKN